MGLSDYALTFTVDPKQLLLDRDALMSFTATLQAQLAVFFDVPFEQVRWLPGCRCAGCQAAG